MARIGIWDIECHTFRFKADQGFMICSGIMELGTNKVDILVRDNIKVNPLNDRKLVLAIRNKLLEFDMIVTHNGKWFDLPWLNSRLVHWGYAPLPNIPHFDTCEVAFKKMRVKNSLEALGKFLGCKVQKTGTDMNDWLLAGGGNEKAIRKIVVHNEHDVKLTAEVYKKMRVFGFKHPNLANINNNPKQCPLCAKTGTLNQRGWIYGVTNKSKRFECRKEKGGCGGWSHTAFRKTDVDIRP